MELPNEHFDDFSIEFKKINPEDFDGFKVDKVEIRPNEDGYIKEELHSKTDIDEKNTMVINVGVGQGKTYSIIEIVKKYHQETDYIIFIASPFVSLVEQYYHKVSESGIPKESIYRYDWIGNRKINTRINISNCRIHIVTANLLLGNPGEENLINSEKKRDHINELISNCKAQKKKVVFIYDEIHDTIHNFKQELIFNLWKWKDVIHKNFVISATFNEASKIVIEYLAELTDRKIQIIESERVRNPEKQSELYLYFNASFNYRNTDENITALVQDLVNKGKDIDILAFSKTLAESIKKEQNRGIGKVLWDKYREHINLCTSLLQENTPTNPSQEERFSQTNRYNPSKCNVGTNFKSGVSIEKENHAFVIILPPLGAKKPFQNMYGIFSDGINSVIQAIARQRKKGEIHMILPPPAKFDFNSLPFSSDENLKNKFKSYYETYMGYSDEIKFYSINQQENLIKEFYENVILENIKEEIKVVEELDRRGLASLKFPNYKDYKLANGEKYLVKTYPFFGGDLSAYVLYCAITNQFLNCRLKEAKKLSKTIIFEHNKVYMGLNEFLRNELDENYLYNVFRNTNFRGAYQSFRNELFRYELQYKKEDGTITRIREFKEPYFEKQLICFVADKFYGIYQKTDDVEYERGEYFRDGIECSEHILVEYSWGEEDKKRVLAFKNLNYFRNKLISNIQTYDRRGNYKYLPTSMFPNFINTRDERRKYNQLKEYFTEKDNFIKNEVFPFKRNLNKHNENENHNSFYKMLLEDFIETTNDKITIDGERLNVKVVEEIIPLGRKIIINHIEPEMEITDDWKEYYDYYREIMEEEIFRNE